MGGGHIIIIILDVLCFYKKDIWEETLCPFTHFFFPHSPRPPRMWSDLL